MFTRREAAAFWITSGICNVVLAQIFLKDGIESIGPSIPTYFKDPWLRTKITSIGLMQCGVGYFGYIQGYETGPYYIGTAFVAVTLAFGAWAAPKGNNFVGWVGLFDLVKASGWAMILYNCPLISAEK